METICRRWETPERYYSVRLERDLFGDWLLTRSWGGKGSRLGRIRLDPQPDLAAGLRAIQTIDRRRLQHQYVLTLRQIHGATHPSGM